MIVVGIDDTDIVGSRGTNQLAREIVRRLPADINCQRIVRHQLFYDSRVPYTSKNGSASISLTADRPLTFVDVETVKAVCHEVLADWYIEGSDPGLCLISQPPPEEILDFAIRCQNDVVLQSEARLLAEQHGLVLEGLGGTNDGVIGAVAAVALATQGNDGRIIQLGEWSDDFSGPRTLDEIKERGVVVRLAETNQPVKDGREQVGKRLRPNVRDNRPVLFVNQQKIDQDGCSYAALKLP